MAYHIKKTEGNKLISFHSLCTILTFIFMLLLICPLLPGESEAKAQDNADGRKADFLFRKPRVYFNIHSGIFFPEADSDIFKMVTRELTLEKSDFITWNIGADFGCSVHKRIDLVFSLDHSKSNKTSEFREYVGEDELPITQSTTFSQYLHTAGIKFLIIPRGRQIGRFSWHPNPVIPYLSGGAGKIWYRFCQHGDFVDDDTLEIFPAFLKTSGKTYIGYLGSGVEFNIIKATYINLDFRYYLDHRDNDFKGDFVGFDPIELGGFRANAGIQWHF